VITGAQVRQARKLLGWEPHKLARRAKVRSLIVKRAEGVASEPPITAYQAALIKQALV
jgi:ribosome-binding protein aMBF1 (putative translation factor)